LSNLAPRLLRTEYKGLFSFHQPGLPKAKLIATALPQIGTRINSSRLYVALEAFNRGRFSELMSSIAGLMGISPVRNLTFTDSGWMQIYDSVNLIAFNWHKYC